jgi:hypothetical protein
VSTSTVLRAIARPSYDAAIADVRRALEAFFPDRAEELLRALERANAGHLVVNLSHGLYVVYRRADVLGNWFPKVLGKFTTEAEASLFAQALDAAELGGDGA